MKWGKRIKKRWKGRERGYKRSQWQRKEREREREGGWVCRHDVLHENETRQDTRTGSVVMHSLYEPLDQMTEVCSATFYLLLLFPPSLHLYHFSPSLFLLTSLFFFIFNFLHFSLFLLFMEMPRFIQLSASFHFHMRPVDQNQCF